MNLKAAVLALGILFLISLGKGYARELSADDCAAMKRMLVSYTEQQIKMTEFKRDILLKSFDITLNELIEKIEGMTGEARYAVERKLIVEIQESLNFLNFEKSDIVPGLIVFNRLCPRND